MLNDYVITLTGGVAITFLVLNLFGLSILFWVTVFGGQFVLESKGMIYYIKKLVKYFRNKIRK